MGPVEAEVRAETVNRFDAGAMASHEIVDAKVPQFPGCAVKDLVACIETMKAANQCVDPRVVHVRRDARRYPHARAKSDQVKNGMEG